MEYSKFWDNEVLIFYRFIYKGIIFFCLMLCDKVV